MSSNFFVISDDLVIKNCCDFLKELSNFLLNILQQQKIIKKFVLLLLRHPQHKSKRELLFECQELKNFIEINFGLAFLRPPKKDPRIPEIPTYVKISNFDLKIATSR